MFSLISGVKTQIKVNGLSPCQLYLQLLDSANMIEARGLTKIFRPGRGLFDLFKKRRSTLALDGVDLQVEEGKVMALLGPNGAGKTTLIKILSALLIPDSGEVKINGCDIFTDGKAARRYVGLVVGEERSFYWRLTGRQNLEFFATLYNLPRRSTRKKISEISSFLGIDNLDQRYQEYSTGTKQRLAIARCLLSDALVIFMDEPTRSLDPLAAAELRRFIREKLAGEMGRTILFSTHQTNEAEEIADQIVIIDRGKIKVQGSLQKLRNRSGMNDASLEEIFRWSIS